MNDFGINIAGLEGVLKKVNVKYLPDKYRHVKILSGPGCEPSQEVKRHRKIEVKTVDGNVETISSYDLEYVIKDGKKIHHIEEE